MKKVCFECREVFDSPNGRAILCPACKAHGVKAPPKAEREKIEATLARWRSHRQREERI
jgi:uncharacterized Zn finger protein (UPF0148 family)